MADPTPAVLRELAQGLTVPTIAEAPLGTRVKLPDDGGARQSWTNAWNIWYPDGPAEDDPSTVELQEFGAEVTDLPVPVDQLTAVREALEGAAAELERVVPATVWAQRAEALAERDRARDTAAALEAECAELRAFVRWINEPFPAAITDAEVVGAIQVRASGVLARTDPLRAEPLPNDRAELTRLRAGLARLRKTPCADCDAAEVAHNLLAETEGGESRG